MAELTPSEIRRRLRRVGLAQESTTEGEMQLVADPAPPPLVDGWTLGRGILWATLGALGWSRGGAYAVAAVWELGEAHLSSRNTETAGNQIIDLTTSILAYEAGRRSRK